MKIIKQILYLYEDADCIIIPRVNYVNGLSEEYIKKWNWEVDEKKRINYPDLQMRIFKLNQNITWIGKVHEILSNYLCHITLPYNNTEDYCLYHSKTFEKQKEQIDYYGSTKKVEGLKGIKKLSLNKKGYGPRWL